MSSKRTLDKTMTALENTKIKTVRVYDFIKGLSVRNKMSFDLSVKSDKAIMPVWKYAFGYNKEIRVMPMLLAVIAALITVCTAVRIGKNCNK